MPKRRHQTQKLSPLIRSAFEFLEHGLWHYFNSEDSTDMRFAILHVDQAIELFLKEKVRKGRRSIYKNPKQTIDIWEAYRIIEQDFHCTIPEKADLELLHEERNSIQHKYLNPSVESTGFYMQETMKFLLRFVKDELELELSDYILPEYIEQLTVKPINKKKK
ncbi:MAG: hypothetical protein AABZ32_05855 [Bacteroidota bacterium]